MVRSTQKLFLSVLTTTFMEIPETNSPDRATAEKKVYTIAIDFHILLSVAMWQLSVWISYDWTGKLMKHACELEFLTFLKVSLWPLCLVSQKWKHGILFRKTWKRFQAIKIKISSCCQKWHYWWTSPYLIRFNFDQSFNYKAWRW